MQLKDQIKLASGSAGAITLVAILASVHEELITVGPWVLDTLLAACGSALLYCGFRVFVAGRAHWLSLRTKELDVQAQEQQLNQSAARHQLEMLALQTDIQVKVSRLLPDQNGNYPVLLPSSFVSPAEIGGNVLMLPPGQAKGIGTRQPIPAIVQQDEHFQDETDIAEGQEIPASVRYEDIKNEIPRGSSCLGVSREGLETCDFKDLMTMLICGGSSTGKTNTVAIKLKEAIDNGQNIHMLVIDPHAGKPDSLYNKIRPYEARFLAPVAKKDEAIIQVLTWFKKEFERRMELSTSELAELDDVLLICDEVFSLVFHREDDRIKKLIKLVSGIAGYESRGYGMYAWFLTQKVSGLKWLRDAVMTTICHKMQTMSERILASNDDRAVARDMDNWTMKGRVVVFGLNLPVIVTQMPLLKTVEGSIEETDEMEALQPKNDLPSSANSVFPRTQIVESGRSTEDAQEADGRRYTAEDLMNPLVLKKFLNEAGKMRAEGASIDGILKHYGMTPGGRNNQNLKTLLDTQAEENQVIG